MAHRESDALAEELVREFNRVSGDRTTFESHLEEIALRVWPAYSGSFVTKTENITKYGKKNQEVYDSTAPIALSRFGAVMESMVTPRNSKWHRLVAEEDELNKDREVRLWLDQVRNLLFKYRYAPKANFASQNQQDYMSLGAFGTATLFIDELADEPGLRYKSVHLGEVYFMENHQGLIDKVFRRFPYTARQVRQKWGEDKLPDKIKTALTTNSEKEFIFLHIVKPREDVDTARKDFKGMAFASYYVFVEDKITMSEGGYNTFPYAISRYVQVPGEIYGRSPAMDVLPAIKTINEEKKSMLRQGHRALDPVLLTHDDGILDTFSMRSGAVNPGGVNAAGKALVHALPVGRLDAGEAMMALEARAINDAFLVTLFQILVETPTMTATEVMERVREKGILIAPTMGRQQSERLGPMIDREIDVLARQTLLPPMPPALKEAGGRYKVEYDSPLSRAQRAEEAAGFMRTLELALKWSLETQNPAVLDHFDEDIIIPAIADIHAVPTKWLRGIKKIETLRGERAEQAQIQQAIAAAPAVAGLVKGAA